MGGFSRVIRFELKKIYSSNAWWIMCALVIVVQPLLALIAAKSYLQIGLDATPELHPNLEQALPPLDYFGFDMVAFGILPMVVFGGITGASEYKHHQLRTTLLCQSSRIKVLGAKIIAIIISTAVMSFLAIYASISITHLAFGELGLHPLYLSSIAWQFIGFSVLDWIVLTLLSCGIGILFRNAVIPLAFLVPQIYNLGNYLAQRWEWGEYLPVAAGNLLFASPTDAYEHDPIKGGTVLFIWLIIVFIACYYTFTRRDVGGRY
ncbi:ABC transporter permease [Paenibacillus sp. YPG26]|uniref:ABC transporter permease n=1 Tax=Paenibacillus sp. YPG26 TaxID=2878915 RepID=UPI00203C9D4B|nr:ABC transporter permease [Paenibacillus sp. YPG26]USB31826.1 ABC transporter permease [Paenibacillus sp. YPG26]